MLDIDDLLLLLYKAKYNNQQPITCLDRPIKLQ